MSQSPNPESMNGDASAEPASPSLNGAPQNGTSTNHNNRVADSDPTSWPQIQPQKEYDTSQPNCQIRTDQLAAYIESKMKEQYLEQAKSLEQLQLKMQQQLLQKQAQLLEQIHSIDSKMYNSSNGQHPLREISDSMNSNAAVSTSGEESGSNVSQTSSHDTWDSSNAFHHERPVLTGSERSTPVQSPSHSGENASGGSTDDELISQSVHIPIEDNRDPDGGEIAALDLTTGTAGDTDSLVSTEVTVIQRVVDRDGLAVDRGSIGPGESASFGRGSTTPREATTGQEREGDLPADDRVSGADDMDESLTSVTPRPSGDLEIDALRAGGESLSSTPPPESPADELSASLRLSLREKHSRHLSNLKAYYEEELAEVKQRLTSTSFISQHESFLALENENHHLRERCRVLEQELLRANRYINTVDKQMEDLETSFTATLNAPHDNTIELESVRGELRQKKAYINSLETKNKELFSALCDAYEVRDNAASAATQEGQLYLELRDKYESLVKENRINSTSLEKAEKSLAESRSEIQELRTAIQSLEQRIPIPGVPIPGVPVPGVHLENNRERVEEAPIGERPLSPVLKAERQLKSADSGFVDSAVSPSRRTSSHKHQLNSRSRPRSSKHVSKYSAPKPALSDTQSSEDSRPDNKAFSHKPFRGRGDPVPDLVSAYSPIVDRTRHSSSASSGPAGATSPNRYSTERPYGYHHVGAAQSPSRRTYQWTALSPFNKTPDSRRSKSAITLNAKKNLTQALDKPETIPNSDAKSSSASRPIRTEKSPAASDSLLSQPTPSGSSPMKSNVQEERLKYVKDAESQLDELLLEKTQLESALTRVSSAGGRQERLKQENLEKHLDRVDRSIGSVRMTLRRYNCL